MQRAAPVLRLALMGLVVAAGLAYAQNSPSERPLWAAAAVILGALVVLRVLQYTYPPNQAAKPQFYG